MKVAVTRLCPARPAAIFDGPSVGTVSARGLSFHGSGRRSQSQRSLGRGFDRPGDEGPWATHCRCCAILW